MKLPANVERRGDCWVFLGEPQSKGFHRRGGFPLLRRMFEQHKGRTPAGHYIEQTCGDSRCVNPAHLKAATKRKAMQVECKRGHPLSGANTYNTPDGRRQCRVCRALRRNKMKGA